jgi:hypothetical protein
MKKLVKKLSFISYLFLTIPGISAALDLQLNYPTINGRTLSLGMNLNELIIWFYYFMVSIAGLASFVMIVVGGISWLTSAGNPSKTTDAKERIFSALLGLLLVLSSWIILKLVNPDLLILKNLT